MHAVKFTYEVPCVYNLYIEDEDVCMYLSVVNNNEKR